MNVVCYVNKGEIQVSNLQNVIWKNKVSCVST